MEIKPSKQLINILLNTKDQLPNYTLFLGAGASVESGIPTGAQLITDWRNQFWELYGDEGHSEKDDFLKQQAWYDSDSEYSVLFETLYDTASQRRDFIETVVGDRKPSWGYMYLVDLLRQGMFNTVFTTNFDDLLNEACYLFSSDVRPIVSAHDSSIRSVRLSSKRPKIIKLHGDFLFDSIKNTVRELESLEMNTREKFREFSNEFGMIAIGYSGTDRSIMDALDALMRDDRAFPHGIYWCIRNENSINEQLTQLARFPNFHLVKIDGYDSFMAHLHKGLELEEHPIVQHPYHVMTDRLTSLLNSLPVRKGIPDVLKNDIRALARQIKIPPKANLPYNLLARVEFEAGNSKEGLEHLFTAIENNSGRTQIYSFCEALINNWHKISADKFVEFAKTKKLKMDGANNIAIQLLAKKRFGIAEYLIVNDNHMAKSCPEFWRINLLQIKAHQEQNLSKEESDEMKNLADSNPNSMIAFGAYCVLGQNDLAFDILHSNCRDNVILGEHINTILRWPIIELLSNDQQTKLKKIAAGEEHSDKPIVTTPESPPAIDSRKTPAPKRAE